MLLFLAYVFYVVSCWFPIMEVEVSTWHWSPSTRLNLHKEVRIWRGKIWEEFLEKFMLWQPKGQGHNVSFNFLCFKSKDNGLQSGHQRDSHVSAVKHRRHVSNFCPRNPKGKKSQWAALVVRQRESWVCIRKKLCLSLTVGQKSVKLRDQE